VDGERIVGCLGLRLVGDRATAASDTVERSGIAGEWQAELRRLRVDRRWRRRGVATRLTQAALQWTESELVWLGLVLDEQDGGAADVGVAGVVGGGAF
jgi:GNAT superfamily N-acetyltransferase